MLEVLSNDVTVATNAPIPLQNVTLLKGCSVSTQGTSSIMFSKCGVYEVNISATATSATETTGTVGIQVSKNGTLQGVAIVEGVADTTNPHSLTLTHLIQVPSNDCKCNCCTSPTTITIQNVGNSAIIDLDVVVTKVC